MRKHLKAIALAVGMLTVANGQVPNGSDTARLPVMTWYHPLLSPGVSDILLLVTVTAVSPAEEKYMNEYWDVTLRIEEPIYIASRFTKRLENIRFLQTGDFRKRTVGERILLFAGDLPYEGDDFLLPCWAGTGTDLGIVLHSKDHEDADKDLELLKQLRSAARGVGDELALYEAFAEFCPMGVAKHLIYKLRVDEYRRETGQPIESETK